jgi:hypothetical protein
MSSHIKNPCDYLSQMTPEMFYIPNTQDVDNAFNTIDSFTTKAGNVLSIIDYIISSADERTSVSLINYVKSSQIASTLFIEDRIAHEEILKDLIINIYNIYTGFIMTAVQLNTAISNSKTVKDAFALVATENYSSNDFNSLDNQLEILNPLFISEKINSDEISNEAQKMDNVILPSDNEDTNKIKSSSVKLDTTKDKEKIYIPSGRTLQISFTTHLGKTINLIMNLILHPVFVPSTIFANFVKFQYPNGLKERWMQWRAGEISFFKDFIFELDVRKEQRLARKQDKTNLLSKMFAERNYNNIQQMKKITTGNNRQNIANTILIVDHDNFTQACKRSHIKFEDPSVRSRFFSTSMSLMLASVDPSLNQIHMYYNGLDKSGIYSFNQMKQNAKSEKTDIMDIMKAFSQGIAPRI